MRPSTRPTFAPYASHSIRKTFGVSFGMKTWHSSPAFAAYAAAAPPALPAVGSAIFRAPRAFAIVTAAPSPRALKEPVGLPASSLM